ncbi:MAG: hypothetical protein H0T73_03585, partial [Ardenticatenales bacterium]|nr:hypothetical protein [Ardenticatenales bacterium]
MTTILMMAGAIGLAHLQRLVLVGQALREQGANVVFAYREAHAILQQHAFPTHVVPDLTPPTRFADNVFAQYTPELIEACVRREREVIEEVRPDVIVGDFRPTAAISTRLARVPFVAIVNAYMTDAFDPVEALATSGGKVQNRAASFIGKQIQKQQKRSLAAPFRQVARAHGLNDLQSLYDFFSGTLTLLAELPEFCPLPHLPASHRYVG